MKEYKIIKSKTVVDNLDGIVSEIEELEPIIRLQAAIPDWETTTWTYDRYNIFLVAKEHGKPLLNFLYEELKEVILEYTEGKTCWLQSWLNYDTHKTVEQNLREHQHAWPVQGYISINPKETKTIFTKKYDYEVINEIGNIYIGPGYRFHKVVNTDAYQGTRITIGWDITYKDPRETPESYSGNYGSRFIQIN